MVRLFIIIVVVVVVVVVVDFIHVLVLVVHEELIHRATSETKVRKLSLAFGEKDVIGAIPVAWQIGTQVRVIEEL